MNSDGANRSAAVMAADADNVIKAMELAEALQVPFLGIRDAGPEGETCPGSGQEKTEPDCAALLVMSSDGLALEDGRIRIRGDFSALLPRIRPSLLRSELLVKASGINKKKEQPRDTGNGNADAADARDDGQETKRIFRAIDATAGLGEDAFLLAAAGFFVTMYEKDPVIAALLRDALERARKDERTAEAASRMELVEGDSIRALQELASDRRSPAPSDDRTESVKGQAGDPGYIDVILLDPMFPERRKSALVKKKFQLLHVLEKPCEDETGLLRAAMRAAPGRILVKRPVKGPFLAGVKPSFSLTGKAVRIDCLLPVYQEPE